MATLGVSQNKYRWHPSCQPGPTLRLGVVWNVDREGSPSQRPYYEIPGLWECYNFFSDERTSLTNGITWAWFEWIRLNLLASRHWINFGRIRCEIGNNKLFFWSDSEKVLSANCKYPMFVFHFSRFNWAGNFLFWISETSTSWPCRNHFFTYLIMLLTLRLLRMT